MEYGNASVADLNVMLQILEEQDKHARIETLATNSHLMGGYLESVYGRKPDLVAHPGINLPSEWSGPRDNRTALYVGRFWQHKRIDLIVQAISRLEKGRLLLVGDGPEKTRLTERVESLKLQDRVCFLGNLSNRDLQKVFGEVTCGVYTPLREPFGIMPLEAASHGLPVVATADAGYTEVLDATSAHFVPGEVDSIAEALESLFNDPETACRMGAAGRKQVESFTWDQTARKLLELFRQTGEKRRAVRRTELNRDDNFPLLGAFYYPWYEAGESQRHWGDTTEYGTVADYPVGGPYSSDDPDLVSQHLTLVKGSGLDYLVVNLQVTSAGLDPFELRAVHRLFERVVEESPETKLCFMFAYDKADSSSIDLSLKWLRESGYLDHPNYLRLETKPVLWYFMSESFIGHFFYHLRDLSEATEDLCRLAVSGFAFSRCTPRQYAEFFDGWTMYSPLQVSETDDWESAWQDGYASFTETKSGKVARVFTLCPGFDDTGLNHPHRINAPFREIGRDEGKTYERMQQACLELPDRPDLVVVNSFNEFHENTQIEPSNSFAAQYIESTRSFRDRLRPMSEVVSSIAGGSASDIPVRPRSPETPPTIDSRYQGSLRAKHRDERACRLSRSY